MTTEKPAFATGFGQSDTRKGSGQPYITITGGDIVAMVQTPQAVAKDKAQWLIPSCYAEHDARCHDAQRAHGQFRWLSLDVDANNLDLTDIDAALASVLGDASRLVYSSRSSTADNRKWRGLIPLASPIAGADFADTQNAFFDLLENASDGTLIPDRALARTGQLIYLPNKGEFYQHHIAKDPRLALTAGHAIITRRDTVRADLAAAATEASATRNKRAAERAKRAVGGDQSPVDIFNAAHSVADLLGRHGYLQAGQSDDWKSPLQSSGSYAVRDFGEFWISLSGSDAAAAIGAATQNGYRHGDSFDLFCHFEHGGNFTAAVAAYGAEIRPQRAERPKARDTGPDDDQAGGNNDPPGSTAGSDPVDLWGSFDPPELPQGLLPPVIEQFARANGDQMGADPAGLAIAALVTCAAAIPDAVKIKVKQHDDWHESARLWAALVGPPSTKKSPIISAATSPLCRLDVEMMRAWQKRVQEYDALTPEEKKGRQRPPQTRLRIEDATIEAAQQVLEGSPWGVLMLQDEMSGFFGAMDKYGNGKGAAADRAFWLRSFNGGQFALNRVSRGAAIIDNVSVSMLGGIQPEPLRKIAGDSVDDGLLQRLFPIMLRGATMGRDEPMPPVNNRYRTLIEALRQLKPPGWQGIGVLEFDNGAQVIRRDLESKHLELQSLETINRKLSSHIGKYDGQFGGFV